MPEKKHNFQVILTVTQYNNLGELALKRSASMGHVLRQLIDVAYLHIMVRHPMCPDGQRCFVPQMHDQSKSQAIEQLNDDAAKEPTA